MRNVSNKDYDDAVRLLRWAVSRIVSADWRDDEKKRQIKNLVNKWKSNTRQN